MSKEKTVSTVRSIVNICLTVDVCLWLIATMVGIFTENESVISVAGVVGNVTKWALIPLAVLWAVLNWNTVKEWLRKFIVSLKRNPSMIPLAMLFVTFLMYSLHLTDMSDTTAKIQGTGMGLAQFCIMLFSLLALVCLLNAFPRRKKPNIPMIVLMFVMFAVIIYCDVHYRTAIFAAVNRAESPIVINKTTEYILDAYNMLYTHMIMMVVSAVLVVTLPIYSKLLKKIKTSVNVEDNGAMDEIELND